MIEDKVKLSRTLGEYMGAEVFGRKPLKDVVQIQKAYQKASSLNDLPQWLKDELNAWKPGTV